MAKYRGSYYRRRAYRRTYQPIPGWSYGGGLKETFDLIVAKFLTLDEGQRRDVFEAWAHRFGTGTAKNAERAYPDWQSGARGMTQATRERIAEVVPPILSRVEQIEIARSLWRPATRRGFQSLTIAEASDSARVIKAYDDAVVSLRGRLAEGLPAKERWLTREIARAVEASEQSAEADVRAKALEVRSQIQHHLALTAPRKQATFALPLPNGQQLVVVVSKLAHPLWRFTQPVVRALTWATVLGGITVGIYLWPSDENPVPAAAQPTFTATVRPRIATPTPRPTVVVAAPTQTRIYIVQPGDSWTGIAAGHGITLSALYAANGLTGPTKALYAGDLVTIPANSGAPSGAAGGSVIGAPGCYVAGRDTCNCSDFASSAAATLFMRTYDPYDVNRLDGDNDGTACDSGGSTTSSSGGSGTRVGAICRDGTRSSATGSGACSHHGGVATWLTR